MANTKTVTVKGLQEQLDALTVFQRVRIPGSVAWSLNEFGFILRKNEQDLIQQTFTKKNKFTVNSPLFKKPTKENPKLVFFLRDNAPNGNSPDRYLEPQVSGGEVYVTRLSRALQPSRSGPLNAGEYVLHWGNPKYKPTPGFISSLVSALGQGTGPMKSGARYARNLRARGKYFIEDRSDKGKKTEIRKAAKPRLQDGYQGRGIYTYRGKKLDLVYRILRKPPTVPAKYDWSEQRMQRLADQHVPKLLLGKLAEF
jgi:hypothetical protein